MIGINYAPELTGIGPYTTGLAEHYAKRGHSVRVVTGIPHYPEWRRMPRPHQANHANPRVTRYSHFIPGAPTVPGRLLYEGTWLASASRGLLGGGIDVVIGIIPSLSGGLLAWLAGRKFGAPVGLVFQDLMGPAAAQSGYAPGATTAELAGRLERSLARHAHRVAIVAEGFRQYLERAGVSSCRIARVRNWSTWVAPGESVSETRARLGWTASDFICLHAGNMGQKQGLDNVLSAASLLANKDIKIVLAGDGNDRRRLIARAGQLKLNNVSFLPLQPRGQFEAMLGAADVLLLNQRGSVADMSLPSKLGPYLLSGRPLVAAVAPESDTAGEVSRAKAGILVKPDDPCALASALVNLRNYPELRLRLTRQGRDYAERYLTAPRALADYDCFLEDLSRRQSHR